MRPSLFTHTPYATPRRAAPCGAGVDFLDFNQLTISELPMVMPMLRRSPWRTCDFTAGGLMMWVDYFRYTYCIRCDTLFIRGVAADDVTRTAFALPVGAMPVEQSVELIREYCRAHGIEALLSAVPEEALPELERLAPSSIIELTDWADYIYDAGALATLRGKKLNKKRNHVNRFMADNPGYTFAPLDFATIDAVREFHDSLSLTEGKSAMAGYERSQVARVLDNLGAYPFEGAVLSVPGRGVVAFTLGEVAGDTLHVHIEKMDHTVVGAGETVNRLFAQMITEHHPEVRYINRQDDAGDPGLRRAKESYHPLRLLRKYNVIL